MSIEFTHGSSRMRCDDGLEMLHRLPSRSVDMVLTDPPYNVSRPSNLASMGRTGLEWGWDGEFDQTSWIEPALAALRPGGCMVVFNDWKNLGLIAAEARHLGADPKRNLLWEKTNPMPRNLRRLPIQVHEHAVWVVKPGRWAFNFEPSAAAPYHRGVFRHAVARVPKWCRTQDNPTRKPLGLFRELIEVFCRQGGLVVDPFAGFGTTLEAAESCGRTALCCELREPTFLDAQELICGRVSAPSDSLPPSPPCG